MNSNHSPEEFDSKPRSPLGQAEGIPLSKDAILAHLVTERIGRRLQILEEIDSTNSHLGRMAEPAEDGTVAAAEHQTLGRGRHGRQWISPPGRNVMFSILLKESSTPAPILTLIGAVAAAQVLSDLGAPVGIKWPNDIVAVEPLSTQDSSWRAPGRKLGGVLCESRSCGRGRLLAILGIGVNINMLPSDFPEDLRDRSTSLAGLTAMFWDRNLLIAAILNRIEALESLAADDSPVAIVEAARRICLTLGRRIRVRGGEWEAEGVAVDLDPLGRLLLRGDAGEITPLELGEVTQTRSVE